VRSTDGCASESYATVMVDASGSASPRFQVPGRIGNVTCPGAGDFVPVLPGRYELAARVSHTNADVAVITLDVQRAETGIGYEAIYRASDPCGAVDHIAFDGRYRRANNLAAFASASRDSGGFIHGTFTLVSRDEARFVAADGASDTLKVVASPGGGR